MKLGSLKHSQSIDGELVVVSQDNKRYTRVNSLAANLRCALETWEACEPSLQKVYQDLNSGKIAGEAFDENQMASCLPRTFLFVDGSAFIYHIKLVRKARNAALPETLLTVPLMYQAESGRFLAPNENIPQRDFSHGTDFEAEVGVIVDDVPTVRVDNYPYGGVKASGFGREGVKYAMDEMSELRTLVLPSPR